MKPNKIHRESLRYLRKRSALIIIIASIIVLLIVLFSRGIPSRLANGNQGRIALKILDEVRRPLLNIHRDIHETQSFPHNRNNSETVMVNLEGGINHSRSLIADFKSAAAYNPELLQRVEHFANTFEDWIKKERSEHDRLAGISPDNVGLQDYDEVYHLIAETSESFSLTMGLLGDAEIPIHKDMHAGSQAVKEMLILGGILVIGLTGMLFFLQWYKNRNLAKFPSENPNPVLRISENGKILFANDAGLPLLNFWGSQIGKTLSGYWHKFILNTLSSNSNKNTEIEYKDRVFSLTFTPVAEGKYVNVYGLDITESKQTKEKLRESNERYRAVFEQAIDSVAIIDADTGKMIEFNKHTHENLGYTREEFKKLHIADIDAVESSGDVKRHIEKIKKEGIDIFETKHRTKEGKIQDILVTTKLLSIPGRNLISSIWRDVTERKQAEEELGRIFDLSIDMICVCDIKKGYFMKINPAFEKTLGYSEEELLKNPFSDFIHPDDRDRTTKEIEEILATGKEVFGFENRYRCKDGSYKWLMWMARPIPEKGITYAVAHDITERKSIENELRKSKENLDHAQQIAHIGSWEWDVEKDIRYWSNETCRIFGLKPQQIPATYETFLNYVHPEDREFLKKSVDSALNRKEPLNIEYRIARNDGLERIVHSVAEVQFDDNGKPLKVIGFLQDITERKKAENELHTKNSYLKLLQVAAVAANEAVDIKDAFQPVLEEICSYSGWQIGHAYVISKDDPNLLEPTSVWWLKDHKHFKEFCDVSNEIKFVRGIGLPGRVLASRKPHWIVDVTRDKNFLRTKIAKAVNIKSGIAFPVLVGSKVVAVMTFFTTKALEPDQQFLDIMTEVGTQLGRTIERKQAEEKLLKSEERYSSLINDVLDTSNVGVFILDKEYRVVWINKAMESFFGLKRDEVIGKEKRQLIKDKIHHIFKDGEKFKESVLNTYDDNTYVENFVCHVLPGDGRKERWLEHWSQPIVSGLYAGGRVEHYTDITKRKLAEEALLQSEKMKAMGIMTSGVAHEFNNILGIISGNAQFLREKYRDHKGLTKALHTISRVADDGAKIVDRMYEFIDIKLDSSRFVRININDLIKQSIDFTMPRWKNMSQVKGINYNINVEDLKKIPAILGNPSELREVFVNIINNALDAMPAGGRLTFSTWREDGNVCVSISDTGKGMSEDVKKMVFDPFFTTRSPEGTGLGMSVTYGIITRHNGKIKVETKKGRGSTFTLKLPMANEANHPDVSSKPGTEGKIKDLKILVVDDEEDMCEILSDFFTEEGHEVKTVNNGADGIRLLKSEYFDLVLCDLAMPTVTGMDIIKALHTLDKRPKLGLITGWKYKMKDLKKADFVVKKPFKFSELRSDVSNVLEADSRTS